MASSNRKSGRGVNARPSAVSSRRISRGQFLRSAGMGAAGIAAAGLGLSGTARASGGDNKEKINFRPLSDWTKNNTPGSSWASSVEQSAATGGFAITMYEDPIAGCGEIYQLPACPVNGNTTIDGYVKERVLNDGRAEITVLVTAMNAPLTVYRFVDYLISLFGCSDVVAEPVLGKGADGYMDFIWNVTFIMDKPGMEIPSLYPQPPPEVEVVSSYFRGSGFGRLTEHGGENCYATNLPYSSFANCPYLPAFSLDPKTIVPENFTPGRMAKVTVIQIGLVSAAIQNTFKGALKDMYPAELINIQEIQ